MKFRKSAVNNPEPDSSREDVRDLAEALNLYRAAMHHVAEREVARRPMLHGMAEPHRSHAFHLRILLAPALVTAVAAGVLVPVYSHLHHRPSGSSSVASHTQPLTTEARASVDDTALMNQIDSDLSEDVPDALRPLADLSDQTATTNSVSEKKNVTHE
jgi:hypothetical protein